MGTIAPGVTYLIRADWGANPRIVGGHLMDGAAEKIEIPVHHTVIVDNDATPDLWETLAEVKAKMRRLQVIRADITDVPYNGVGFLMADRSLIVCEGRGPNRSGAHTIGHNRRGYGFALEGDMEALPNPDVSLWVPKLNRFFGWLKAEQLPRLSEFVTGHEHGPYQFFPHQQVSQTLCPGRAVIPVIDQFRYELAEEEDMLILITGPDEHTVYCTNLMGAWWVENMDILNMLVFMGAKARRVNDRWHGFVVEQQLIDALLKAHAAGGTPGPVSLKGTFEAQAS